MVTKPSETSKWDSFDSSKLPSGQTRYQLATSARSVSAFVVTAGGSAVAVRIYDTANGQNLTSTKNIILAANAGESTSFTPARAMTFKKGILLDFEQGGPDQGGGELSYILDE